MDSPKGRAADRRRLRRVGLAPFGIGHTKPRHFLEMARVAWENRRHLGYALRVLDEGVCDGCALGTTGMRDWTLDGTHLCLVRLELLRLNTLDALDPAALADVAALGDASSRDLRELGRLPYPMRRRAGEPGFTRVSWDEALAEIGARIAASDPDRIACYMTSRGITNEVYFAAQKAWRALGSPHIDNAARLCHSPSTVAMKKVVGESAATCSYRDWYDADVIVFFGSNPANDQPVALKYLYEAKKRGARVLVVNTYEEPGMKRYWIPSNADSALFGTEIADAFYKVATGGDQAFVHAVQKLLIGRLAVDREFIARSTEGYAEYKRALDQVELDELVRRSGATLRDVIDFAAELDAADKGVFVWSMGVTQHAHGTDTVAAICSLGLSLGFVGRQGCGLMPIRGHSGVQGGGEMGAYATAFPGRPITEAAATELEALWGFRPPARVGLDTTAMLEVAGEGGLDVLYSIGGNFLDTLPQPEEVARCLGEIPFRVHQDLFPSPPMLIEPRDTVYLLPSKTRYEHEGGVTETTTERRVVYSPFIPGHPVGEAREEWRIAVDLALAARPNLRSYLDYPDADAVRMDIERSVPDYAGISALRKRGDHFQWGGPHLCEGGAFRTPSGRACFVYIEAPDRRLPKGWFHLATRRGKQFNSILHRDHDGLTGAERDHVFMCPSDMEALGLAPDQRVVLSNEHGRFEGRVFAAEVTPGNVQMHWPEANVLIQWGKHDRGGLVPDYNAVVQITTS